MANEKLLDVEPSERLAELLAIVEIDSPQIIRVGNRKFEIKFLGHVEARDPTEFLSKGGPLEEDD
ncbi:hypothetical protein HED50_14725 [Ochrobactrum oryzae]|uniref:hypothetical protein n=1 Tax=Brucella oryzae TaxID=335286 RepID=UPI0016B06EB0|nr:hypothetical protein [Brucella oryzae]